MSTFSLYKKHWKQPFKGGSKAIYRYGGGSNIRDDFEYIGDAECWKDFAKRLKTSRKWNEWFDLNQFPEDVDPDDFKSARKFFDALTSTDCGSDSCYPVLFLTEDNPLVKWRLM